MFGFGAFGEEAFGELPSSGTTSSASFAIAGAASTNFIGSVASIVSASFAIVGTSTASFIRGATVIKAAFTIAGIATTNFITNGVTPAERMPRLPLDPLYPVTNDISLLRARMYQVYRQVAIHANTLADAIDKLNGY